MDLKSELQNSVDVASIEQSAGNCSAMCRVCMIFCKPTEMAQLFNENNTPSELATIFFHISGITFNETETNDWPKLCCPTCTSKLRQAAELGKLCQESDRKLRKMFNESITDNIQTYDMHELKEVTHSEGAREQLVSEIKCEPFEENNTYVAKEDCEMETEEDYSPTDAEQLIHPSPLIVMNQSSYVCCRCSIRTDSIGKLIEHGSKTHQNMLKNTEKVKLFCNVCYRSFTRMQNLKTHQTLWNRLFKCPECFEMCHSKNKFISHWIMDHSERSKFVRLQGHYCCGCNSMFNTPEDLKNHSDLVHLPTQQSPDEQRPFVCDICFHNFRTEYCLERHKRRLVLEAKRFQCTVCGGTYKCESMLRDHEATHHRQDIFKCTYCAKTFAVKQTYRKHMRKHRMASEGDRFKCEECDKLYSTRSGLKTHSLIHSGERPLQCSYCPSKFGRREVLQSHIRGVHEKAKFYACSLCPRRFNYSSDLGRHMMSHTGIKPHKCIHCNQTYQRKDNLKRHMMKNHLPGDSLLGCNESF